MFIYREAKHNKTLFEDCEEQYIGSKAHLFSRYSAVLIFWSGRVIRKFSFA